MFSSSSWGISILGEWDLGIMDGVSLGDSLVMLVKWTASFSAKTSGLVFGSKSEMVHCLGTLSSLILFSNKCHRPTLPAAFSLSDSLTKYLPFCISSVLLTALSIFSHFFISHLA